jgi:uncharacterized protein (TIGR02058 family)
MAKKRVAMELGMGSSLRNQDYTKAGLRAVENALWHNALSMADAFGFPKDSMIIDVDIAVQNPDAVDRQRIAQVFPYGQVSVTASQGGLDVEKPSGDGVTVIAHAAIVVSFDMEPATSGHQSQGGE